MQYGAPQPMPRSAFGLPYPPTTSSQKIISAGQLPAFQPAPGGSEEAPAKPQKKGSSVGLFLTLLGGFLLTLVALTPIWDAARLINNETFVYFIGRSQPFDIILFCCAVVLLFVVVMMLVVGCGRADVQTDSTFMYLFTTTVTLLGLGLLLFSIPLQESTTGAYNELMVSSTTGVRTQPLASYYSELLTMRVKPDCIGQTSVEQCPGFKEKHPYTGYLKYMESTYQCSGFGYTPGSVTLPKTTPAPLEAVLLQSSIGDSTALLQASADVSPAQSEKSKVSKAALQALHAQAPANQTAPAAATAAPPAPAATPAARAAKAAAAPAAKAATATAAKTATAGSAATKSNATDASGAAPTWVKLPEGLGDTVNNMQATGWMAAYPPTLFTNANFKTSCEGAAARDLRFTAGETAHLMYLTGAALLVVSVVVGFLKLCSMCRTREDSLEDRVEKIRAAADGGESQYHTFSQKIVL